MASHIFTIAYCFPRPSFYHTESVFQVGIPSGALAFRLVVPQDPANLLIMPGREKVELIMTHKSKVIDTQVTFCELQPKSFFLGYRVKLSGFQMTNTSLKPLPVSTHINTVTGRNFLKVVEDSEGPAVVVGCDDGAVYAWDLSGHDKGQIYAEMRSLSPLEVPSRNRIPKTDRTPTLRQKR